MSFTHKILAGLFAGIALGLFLGEIVAPLEVVGKAFIGMLQMTVLPYIVLSLVVNLGRVSWAESRGLLLTIMAVFAIFLSLGALVLALTPLAFPPTESASFFSSSLVSTPPVIDLVNLYIPSNPFASLANNMVPAVVLFSIFLGIGLSSVPGSGRVLDSLEVLSDGLNRVNKLMIKLTPIGVFAIAASTAGTLSTEELFRMQGYIITYTLLVAVMSFLIIPLFVNAVTPFSMRDLMGVPKNSLITIFATAKIIILIPQLVSDVIEMFKRRGLDNEEVEHEAGIVLPLAYPFPHLGTYVILMFIAFAAWYVGRPMDWQDQAVLQGASLFSSFISPLVGIPFLLDIMRLPSEVMDLFVVSAVYTDRIRVVLGAMHLLGMTVIILAIRRGVFQPDWRKIGIATAVSVVSLVTVLLGTRLYLSAVTAGEYHGDEQLLRINWMERSVEAVSWREELPPADPAAAQLGRLEAIAQRGTLRVAYLPDSLPWAFTNTQGVVTGFDIELANAMARDLDVSLELVRSSLDEALSLFASGRADIVMSGLAKTPDRLRQFRFAGSALDFSLGFLVPDHRRKAFSSYDQILKINDLDIGIIQHDAAFQRQIQAAFPNAKVHYLPSPRTFLRGESPEIDAVVHSAEGGSAWTLIYPNYSVAIPQPIVSHLPAGFIVPPEDDDWAAYVDEWVSLRRSDGTVDMLFKHWIKGQGAESKEPRWSVIRNVLGWVD